MKGLTGTQASSEKISHLVRLIGQQRARVDDWIIRMGHEGLATTHHARLIAVHQTRSKQRIREASGWIRCAGLLVVLLTKKVALAIGLLLHLFSLGCDHS